MGGIVEFLKLLTLPFREGREERAGWVAVNIMLKHEDNPQVQLPTAASVRVTPEELAAAITALQIRKEGQPGTIAIGDAVEELGLDVTPEEVLAEVQARRQAKPKEERRSRGQRFVLALGLATTLLGLIGGTNNLLHQHDDGAPQAAVKLQANTLAGVGDNLPFYVDTHGLEQIVSGDTPASIPVHRRLNPTYAASDWQMIKHGEKVYVQGYMVQSSEKQVRSSAALDLYNREDVSFDQHPDIGRRLLVGRTYYASSHVTLPVTDSTLSDSEQMDDKARAKISTQPDSHLWDNF